MSYFGAPILFNMHRAPSYADLESLNFSFMPETQQGALIIYHFYNIIWHCFATLSINYFLMATFSYA